jgi:hypothetical protein
MTTCEFIQGSKKDGVFTRHDIPCGKPAAQYRCEGELSAIQMALCDFHKNFVINNYKWNLKVVHG